MQSFSKLRVFSFLAFCLFFPFAAPGTEKAQGSPEEISEEALISHVLFLASDGLEGRSAGERGDEVAAAYIRSIFDQVGLRVLPGMEGFFQEFDVVECQLDREASFLAVESGYKTAYFRIDREVFYSLKGRSDLTVRAPLVFAGFGITAPEYNYDDYVGVDVTDKVVLVFNHEPGEKSDAKKFRGRAPTRYANPRVKEEIARRNGALGVVIINDEANGHPDLDKTLLRRYGKALKDPFLSLPRDEEPIPVFYATKEVAGAIVEGTGVDLLELQERIDKSFKPASRKIPGKLAVLNVRLSSVEKKRIANVVGYVEGSDPLLKGEYILVGAHHDHLGRGDGGKIFYGADDNASGTAGLLESAGAVASRPGSLGRSVIFVSFCGEEKGLLGSRYFAEQPPVPREKIRVMIDVDMIGRNNMDKEENENMFIVFTSAQTPALEALVRAEAESLDFDVRVAPYLRFRGGSDHGVFHKMGIPVLFYFSGYHSDYHKETDTADKLIPGKMAKVTGHLIRVLGRLSSGRDIDLTFDRRIRVEPPKDKFERPY